MSNIRAECYFLDVGQGASQVILLRNGDALVIDTGDEFGGEVPLAFLNAHLASDGRIPALVISHNHRDHASGADLVMQEFAERIDYVFFPKDRPAPKCRTYRLLRNLQGRGRFKGGVARLEVGQPDVSPVYPLPEPKQKAPIRRASAIKLLVLAPSFSDDLQSDGSQPRDKPNRIAGILQVVSGSRNLILSGDAPIAAWESLGSRMGKRFRCDVMTAPHHGGELSRSRKRVGDHHAWIYEHVVKPTYVIFSVGTDNEYGHPFSEAVEAARNVKAVIMCTQITERCTGNLEAIRPGVISPQPPCRSSSTRDVNNGGMSRNVACASTILCQLTAKKTIVARVPELQVAIDARTGNADWKPLCRR